MFWTYLKWTLTVIIVVLVVGGIAISVTNHATTNSDSPEVSVPQIPQKNFNM